MHSPRSKYMSEGPLLPSLRGSWEQASSMDPHGAVASLKALEKQEEAQRLPPCGEKKLATWKCLRSPYG